MADLSKKQRADSARQRAEQMRLEAEARSRRVRTLIIGITIAVVAVLGIGSFIAIQNARQQDAIASAGPAGTSEHGGVMVGKADAKVTVVEYTDFMCPACKQWETMYSDGLNKLKDEGKVKIEYVPVSILDRFSNGTKFSTRAASAGYCVIGNDKDKFPAFMSAMYENQPAEQSAGLTNQEISEVAKGVGASTATTACITGEKYTKYATKVTEDASKAGLTGTPYIVVNGKAVDSQNGGTLEKSLKEAGVDFPTPAGAGANG